MNLGLLFFFKYLNFFGETLTALCRAVSIPFSAPALDIVLPVGISFYTFQTLSYTIDVYRGRLEPERDFVSFALFVSFFPQLVAGPIEKASSLLPQLKEEHPCYYKICPMFVAASHRRGTSHCPSCTMERQWSDGSSQELCAR